MTPKEFKRLRLEAKLTQYQLAGILGVTERMIGYYETVGTQKKLVIEQMKRLPKPREK